MKLLKVIVIIACLALAMDLTQYSAAKSVPKGTSVKPAMEALKTFSPKGAQAVPGAFQVTKVSFETVIIDNQTHLVAAVIFNKNIDASTVKENVNIRMLKQNENNFWVDASTQNNTVRIRPNFITWVSGAPLASGVYKMHLRGTIKSSDGILLDCDGDGKGEGGNMPAYESQLYTADIIELEEADPSRVIDIFNNI